MILVGFDTETERIGTENVAPPLVCATFAHRDENGDLEMFGLSEADEDGQAIHDLMESFLSDKEIHFTGQKIAFDFAVVAHRYEDLLPLIFQAYEDERIHDLPSREKCLNLSDHGSVASVPVPSGKPKKIFYHLADLAMRYLGVDLSSAKDDEDSWRLHYDQLIGTPFEDYPEDAKEYALDDAMYNVLIHECQDERVESDSGPVSLSTAVFQSAADFALYLITCTGFPIDPEERERVRVAVEEELVPEKMVQLLESGVLRAGESPRPYKSKAQRVLAAEALGQKVEDVEVCVNFTDEEVEVMREAGVKLTKGVKQSINKKLLHAVIETAWEAAGLPPVMTEATEKNPDGQISAKAEVLAEIVEFDDTGILAEYIHRAKLQKIVTTELPRMLDPETGEVARVVHPNFDNMKETSRTSSFAGSLYASFNCQNVDPRVRGCYVAEEDHVLCSIDYDSVELCTAAQTQLDLFGHSALADVINSGKDAHGYLGAQLAYHLHSDFRATCDEKKVKTANEVYDAFIQCKGHKEKPVRDFFKHWRTFAKPTGLGYPGGLGAKTFITYAKGSFGVEVTLEEAEQLKSVWLATFPEFGDFFQWITQECVDPSNHRIDQDGNIQESYAYYSPLGTYRANCTFCQAANGRGLQTPTAEGAKKAQFDLVRAQFDETQGSILFAESQTLAFVHDEDILHLPWGDRQRTHDMAFEAARIMVESMQPFMPDIKLGAQPALMRRWDKRAETVLDENGLLDIWTPEA